MRPQKNASIILTVCIVTACWSIPAQADVSSKVPADRPNIIVIIADDLGYADVSAYGHHAPDIRTPNIDRLAVDGIRFTQGYVTSPVCSASRLGLLTSRYQQRWGVDYYGGAHLPHNEHTYAEQLQRHGYATGLVGKHHVVEKGRVHPMDFGFDHFYGFNHGTKHFFIHTAAGEKLFAGGNLTAGPMWVDRQRKDQHGYATELFRDEALEFVDRHKDKPFLLHWSFNAVHLFIQVPEKDLQAEGIPPFAMWDPEKEPGHKGYINWYFRTLKRNGDDPTPHDPHGRARYRICLRYMDQAIGAMLDRLKQHGIDDNTLIVFLSDNGGSPRSYAVNKPLRDWKYDLYEGGVRVPFILRWPKRLAQGKVETGVISALDVGPTILSAAGIDPPDTIKYDGADLLPALTGQVAWPTDRRLFWQTGKQLAWAVRDGDWKLVRHKGKNGVYELYNLAEDLAETTNLAGQQQEIAQRLKNQFAAWRKSIGRPVNKP